MLKGKRVLFLDDERYMQDIVRLASCDYDLQLVTSETAGEARKQLAESGPFDAAILDVGVINGDGILLYQWIKDTFPRIQVIFLTGDSTERVADKIHAIGSAPVYTKPTLLNAGFIQDLFERMGCRRRIIA